MRPRHCLLQALILQEKDQFAKLPRLRQAEIPEATWKLCPHRQVTGSSWVPGPCAKNPLSPAHEAEFRKELLSLRSPLPAPCQGLPPLVTKRNSPTQARPFKIALGPWAIRKRNKAGSEWGLTKSSQSSRFKRQRQSSVLRTLRWAKPQGSPPHKCYHFPGGPCAEAEKPPLPWGIAPRSLWERGPTRKSQ